MEIEILNGNLLETGAPMEVRVDDTLYNDLKNWEFFRKSVQNVLTCEVEIIMIVD